jgi:ribonuclease HII
MIELKFIPSFPQEILATDEVGRGPLGGPVVVSAVKVIVWDKISLKEICNFLRPIGVTDSKKLTPDSRRQILNKLGIHNLSFRTTGMIEVAGLELSYVTWDMDHNIIDSENILAASLRGMKEACLHLSEQKKIPTTVLIDGHKNLRWDSVSPWNEVPIIQGDSKSVLIGLASMIAKEKRDIYMRDMHDLYPQYGFASHFGYPTKEHRQAIEQYGPCPIHRKTFKGVKEFLRM